MFIVQSKFGMAALTLSKYAGEENNSELKQLEQEKSVNQICYIQTPTNRSKDLNTPLERMEGNKGYIRAGRARVRSTEGEGNVDARMQQEP